MIGDPTYADVILDRLVHNAHRIELPEESLRIQDRGGQPHAINMFTSISTARAYAEKKSVDWPAFNK